MYRFKDFQYIPIGHSVGVLHIWFRFVMPLEKQTSPEPSGDELLPMNISSRSSLWSSSSESDFFLLHVFFQTPNLLPIKLVGDSLSLPVSPEFSPPRSPSISILLYDMEDSPFHRLQPVPYPAPFTARLLASVTDWFRWFWTRARSDAVPVSLTYFYFL